MMRPFVATVGALLGLVFAVHAVAAWEATRVTPREAAFMFRESDHRLMQRARITMAPPPRVAAFGSSRVMSLSTTALGLPDGAFINVAVGGASLEDHVALWSVMRRQRKIPQRVLFSVDTWLFNVRQPPARWRSMAAETEEFLDRRGLRHQDLRDAWDAAMYRWERGRDLLSISTLRTSLRDLRRVHALRRRAGAAELDLPVEEGFGRPWWHETVEDARQKAVEFAEHGGDTPEFAVDPRRVELLRTLWDDMRAEGVEIIAYTAPYHPEAYRRLRQHAAFRSALASTVTATGRLAQELSVRFEDFSDPQTVPCPAAEFFDGHHAKAPCLARALRQLTP